MTSLLDQAVDTARSLPVQRQDELAQIILFFAKNQLETVKLSDEDDKELSLSVACAERGEFASSEDISNMWAKHGL